MSAQKALLIEAIKAAFAEVEFPGNWCLQRSHEGDEPFAVAEDFKDKTDRYDIPAEFLDNSPKGLSSALSFLLACLFNCQH